MKRKVKPSVRIEVRGSVVQDWTGTDKESFVFLNKLKRMQTRFVKETGNDWPLNVTVINLESRAPKMKAVEVVMEVVEPVKVFVPDW